MSTTKYPSHPWQRNWLVVALETIDLRGERVPLAYSQMTVENRQITTSLHIQVAWGKSCQGQVAGLSEQELQQAVATACTLRNLSAKDLMDGDTPRNVFSLVEGVFRTAARHDTLIVMHDPERDLPVLAQAVKTWTGTDVPPLSAVSTAVLERARRLGSQQGRHESAANFYRRIALSRGELPDLLTCSRELNWTDDIVTPGDRLFPALATLMVYGQHFGGRLLRATPDRRTFPSHRQ